MKRLLTFITAFGLIGFIASAWAASTNPSGNTGDVQYNNAGKFGPYVLGTGLVVTTSGSTKFLSSTATGGVAPSGPEGAIQNNTSGSFGSYTIGLGLTVTGGALTATVNPAGLNGAIQYNNGGVLGAYNIGSGLSVVGGSLVATSSGGSANPGGTSPQLQYNTGTTFGGLSANTPASYAAHDTVMNGLAFDPRNPAFGAVCGGSNHFSGDGTTKTFTYTIPFVNSTPTSTAGFFVFYEADGGFGAAVLLTGGTDYTVTGANSGVGGTITLTGAAVPSGSSLYVFHDDGPGIAAASTAAPQTGGYVAIPNGCTIYTSQTNGTILADGAQLIGQNFTPSYPFQPVSTKPVVTVIAPEGASPNFGFNISGKNYQFFRGFAISDALPVGNPPNGFLRVPVLIGTDTTGAGGGGGGPGINVEYMDFNYARVGFGIAETTTNAGYIFATARFNNFNGNDVGAYGPFSDGSWVNNNFSANGGFGGAGTSGGLTIIGGSAGGGGATKLIGNRFEFNLVGLTLKNGFLVTVDGNEFDSNSDCGLDLRTSWGAVDITGGWFRANGKGGNTRGNTTAGQDAHICVNGPGNGLHIANTQFLNGWGRSYTAPIGSLNANTPLYFLDVNTAASGVSDISTSNIDAQNSFTSGAYVKDFAIYRQGQPSGLKIDAYGQAAQGQLASGQFSSMAHGLPSNSQSALYVFGDIFNTVNTYMPSLPGQIWPNILGQKMSVGPKVQFLNNFSPYDCDVADQVIFPNYNTNDESNPTIAWLPSVDDPGYNVFGHLTDTNACHMAAYTWMTIPKKYKTYAQAASVTTSGTWGTFGSYGGQLGLTSTEQGDTMSIPVTSTNGPIYLGYELQAVTTGVASGGKFTYNIDGDLTTTTTVATAGSGQWTFACGGLCPTSQAPAAVRIPLSATTSTSHVVNINLVSTTTATNPVTILGAWVPPAKSYADGNPTIYVGGYIYQAANANASAVATYYSNQMTQANQLLADGLSVNFVPTQNYLNTSLDYLTTGGGFPVALNGIGQVHVAQAFGASMQYEHLAQSALNPINYGATCNTKLFAAPYNDDQPHYLFNTTSGSNVVSVSGGYIFQPDDVGRVMVVGRSDQSVGPTTYIASINTTNNTATVGTTNSPNGWPLGWPNGAYSTQSGTNGLITGRALNPNDPSTATDDTTFIQNASAVAAASGGRVFLPNDCSVHNLIMTANTELVGNEGGVSYFSDMSPKDNTTNLYISSNANADDPTQIGINIGVNATQNTRYKDFAVHSIAFPYSTTKGDTLACFGHIGDSGGFYTEQFVLDHVNITNCPVGLGIPMGLNFPVTITAQQTGTDLNVTAITSTGFIQMGATSDWLALGRTITGVSITSTNKIVGTPDGTGGLGHYTMSAAFTTSSETMTSPAQSGVIGGQTRDSSFDQDFIGINGALSDFSDFGSTWTGEFGPGVYMGPNQGNNSASQFNSRRFEENGNGVKKSAAFICDACTQTMINSTFFQFGDGPAVELINGWQHFQITGGGMEGNNSNGAQIVVGGSGHDLDVSGVWFDQPNFSGGGNSAYILATSTGSTSDYISINGGNARTGFSTAFANFAAGGTPTHYQQNTPGIPRIDTTQTTLSISTTGAVGIPGPTSFTDAVYGGQTSVAISTSTFTPNFLSGQYFSMLLVHAACPCTVANPTNLKAGQSGIIEIDQSATGGDTVSWGTDFKFPAGFVPVLSTGANNQDYFSYYVRDTSNIIVSSGILNAH